MTIVYAYQERNLTKDITILDVDGDAIVPTGSDKIRAIIGHEGKTPVLTVASDAPTDNGSSFTPDYEESGKNRLRLDAQDLTFPAGIYTLFIDFQDAADGADWKNVDRQVFCLEQT